MFVNASAFLAYNVVSHNLIPTPFLISSFLNSVGVVQVLTTSTINTSLDLTNPFAQSLIMEMANIPHLDEGNLISRNGE